jgi:hypothetical protein
MEDTTQTSKESRGGDRLSHQKEWLVKVNGRILGPYTFDEVSQLLNNHNLVSHDEIVQPRGRWKMIRHEEKFREVLNEIRNRQASRGEQVLDSTFGGSITVTEGVTATTELLDDGFRNTSKLIKDFDEQVKRPQGEERSSSETEVESRDLSKSYAAKNDPKAQKKFKKAETIKIAIALAVFILTGIFSLVKFSFPHKEGGKTRLDAFSEAMNQGELYERFGEQAKAIAAYNEARNLKASDINMLIHLAPLTFLYEKQSLQANRMFKQVLEGAGENADYKKRSYMGLGLVALDSHELDVAPSPPPFSKAFKI